MNNFSRLLFYLLLSGTIVSLDSCVKKGEDDPFVSLRTRKNRVVGDWVALSGSVLISSDSWTESYTVKGNTVSINSPAGGATGTANVLFKFGKKGEFESSINMGGFTSYFKGSWNFSGRVGDHKNKSQLVMHSDTYTSSSGVHVVDGNQYDMTYEIEELKNKEMRLHYIWKNTDASGSFNSYSETWTLTQ